MLMLMLVQAEVGDGQGSVGPGQITPDVRRSASLDLLTCF